MPKKITVIVGPTAVGKTDYSIKLAQEYNCPIISCDSRQLFKEMHIGTASPSEEQLNLVKHYFIKSHSVTDYYTAGRYEIEAVELVEKLFLTCDNLVMVGGSGLYVDAFCKGLGEFPATDWEFRKALMERLENEGLESLRQELKMLDPEAYYSMDVANRQRVVRALEVNLTTGQKYSSFKNDKAKERSFDIEVVCLERDREELYDRINKRVLLMIEQGLVEEVESLKKYRDMPALNTVGYKEIFDYLDGNISQERAIELIQRNTRHYAKRQMTWWRKENKVLVS